MQSASKTAAPSSSVSLFTPNSEEVSRLDRKLTTEQGKNGALQQQVCGLRTPSHGGHERNETPNANPSPSSCSQAPNARGWEETRSLPTSNSSRTNTGIRLSSSSPPARKSVNGKRTAIAEHQAKDGVALIRATFEVGAKCLEEDLRSWKRMVVFVVEEDRRTNDEVRMRAASEPERRVKDGLAKRHELELEVARANSTLERLDGMDRRRIDHSSGNGHQFVYQCFMASWRRALCAIGWSIQMLCYFFPLCISYHW